MAPRVARAGGDQGEDADRGEGPGAASDLVPEVNKGHSLGASVAHFACFLAGLSGLYVLATLGS